MMCGGLPCVRKFKSQRKQNQRNRRSLHRRVKITNELLFKLFVYFLIAKRFINNQGGPSAETMEAAVADVNVLSPGSPRGVRSDSDYSSYSSYSHYSSYSYSCTPPRTAGLEVPLPSEPAVAETAGAARLPAMPDAGPVAPQAPPSTFQLSKGAAPFWPGVEIVAPGSAVTPPTTLPIAALTTPSGTPPAEALVSAIFNDSSHLFVGGSTADNKSGYDQPAISPKPMNRATEEARNAAFAVSPIRPSVQMGGDGESDADELPKMAVIGPITYKKFVAEKLADIAFAKDLAHAKRCVAASTAWHAYNEASGSIVGG